MQHYRGLTWDHPRGRTALEAAALHARSGNLDLAWSTHSLEGFESSSITKLATEFDIIVLDHPHLGEALESDSLVPLEELFGADELTSLAMQTVGPSLDSYRLEGHTWALPLDAATQVAALRTDLVEHPPDTWEHVESLSRHSPVALTLAGPHAFLTFASVCVGLGEEPASGEEFISQETGSAAIELLIGLADRAPQGSDRLNPIALLETMSSSDSIVYCPLIFGYVNYTNPARGAAIQFMDAPSLNSGGRPGSTIGGTGIALTRRCPPSAELLDHLRWLLNPTTQRTFITAHEGQPSARAAWDDEQVNQASRNFYRNTRSTIETAWVRPRYSGFIAFQTAASALVRSMVARTTPQQAGLNELQRLFTASVAPQEKADHR